MDTPMLAILAPPKNTFLLVSAALDVEFKCVLNGCLFELEEQPNRVVEFEQDGVTAVEEVFDQP